MGKGVSVKRDSCTVQAGHVMCHHQDVCLEEEGYLGWATHPGGDIFHELTFIQPRPFSISISTSTNTIITVTS